MNRLLTIPLSHYCERARWALDHCGVGYVEEPHLQMFHLRPVKRAAGPRRYTVPVLVTPGATLSDSQDIVRFADERAPRERRLYPEDERARAEVLALDTALAGAFGVETRRAAYAFFLDAPSLVLRYNNRGAPFHQGVALRVGFPFAKAYLRRYLKINDDTVSAAFDTVRRTFDEIAARLADGRPYLVGERLSAADITFAALAGPVVAPKEYGSGFPQPEEMPEKLRTFVDGFRSHEAGRFALRLYAEERRARR